ncbi:MAG TPA: cytochrome c [Verrucomicrobiae bacterium]|nr:cytochrome c [Verrucomicrobiae bacterium]
MCLKFFALTTALWVATSVLWAQTNTGPVMPGLLCTATDGKRSVTFVLSTADFTLQPDQSIHPQLGPQFKADFDGSLTIDRPGVYELILTENGEIAGRQQVRVDETGVMSIHFSYERKPGIARQQLWWRSEFFKQPEPVPWDVCVHRGTPAELDATGKIAAGRQLIEDLNCTGCHRSSKGFVRRRAAPVLTDAGSRLKAEWIFKWLENPRHFQSSAVMPVFQESAQDRADITAFLLTQKAEGSAAAFPRVVSDRDGKALFVRYGCNGCHSEGHDGLEGLGSKMDVSSLALFLENPIAVDPSGRMPGQYLTHTEAAQLAFYLAESTNANFAQPIPASNAERGSKLIRSSGCLNCHVLRGMETGLTAPALDSLHGEGGCLAAHPAANVPNYELAPWQRECLRAYLESPDVSEAPVQDFHRRIDQFQCTACHALNGPAKLSFAPNQTPPSLVDAGNKLRRSWIEKVFGGVQAYPWITARMPDYGRENIAFFFDGFAQQAGAELGEGARITDARVDMIDDGMTLIGTDAGGLSCLTCHDFRGVAAGAETRAPDLTKVDDMVRTDWCSRWLYQPSRIVHRTSMPDFFAGKPDWMVEQDVNRLLMALSLGPKMPAPAGWHQDPRAYIIEVSNEPVALHCFLPDSSPRSMAVGLPGRVSYCFDLNGCQMRYAWTGDFLDVKGIWTLRGAGPPRVLGNKFYTAPPGFPLRIGEVTTAPRVTCQGYDLINDRPQFRYDIDGVPVREWIIFTNQTLNCVFDMGSLNTDAWFNGGPQASVDGGLAPSAADPGWWKIPGGSNVRFTVTIPVVK